MKLTCFDLIAAFILAILFGLALACNGAEQSAHPTIMAVTAAWCPPCKQAHAIIEAAEQAGELAGISIIYVDIDRYPALAKKYNVTSVPTFFVGVNKIELRTHYVHIAIAKAKELRDDN